MSDRLLLRLSADGSLAWLTQDAGGRALSGANAGVPPAQTLARAMRIVVLVPAESVLLLETPAVAGQRAQLAKAVPFALEERLASPVEDLHFALAVSASGPIAVGVVAREMLRGWLDALAAQGIRPDVLISESQALPCTVDVTTLLIDGERALLRSAPCQASTCEVANLPDWLKASSTAALEVFDFRAAAALPLPNVLRYHERQRDALAFFAAHLPADPKPNLLQGEFAAGHRQVPAQKIWRVAALLAVAAVLLGFVWSIGGWLHLRRQSAHLDTAMRTELHKSFPKFDTVAGDPYQLMQSELARLRGDAGSAGVLPLLGRIAPVLGGTTRVLVKGIEYHNATLELSLRAPDAGTLDRVREQISTLGGLQAELVSANSVSEKGDGTVEGRIRVTAVKS